MRTRIRRGFGFLCVLVLTITTITVVGEIWIGNRDSTETTVAFGILLLSVMGLAALRDRPAVTTSPVPGHTNWDPETIGSAKRRSEGIE